MKSKNECDKYLQHYQEAHVGTIAQKGGLMKIEKENGWLKRIHGSVRRNFVALIIVVMVLAIAVLVFETRGM